MFMRLNRCLQRNAGAEKIDCRTHIGGYDAIAADALLGQSIARMRLSRGAG